MSCQECTRVNKKVRKVSNPQQFKDSKRRWRQNQSEAIRAYKKSWREENRPLTRASNARRRAAKLERTPAWADLDRIKEIYRLCPEGHHVDHVIPLQGELVSGLHVPENLQYLPAEDNLKKSNQFATFDEKHPEIAHISSNVAN